MLTAIENRNFPVSLKEPQRFSALSFSAISEAGWFLICLALFVVLGPFAAPIALIAVFTCQSRDEREVLPEPECVE